MAISQFVDKVVENLADFRPKECNNFGELKVREFIFAGISEAKRHLIFTEYNVVRYIFLKFFMGEQLNSDVLYKDIESILINPNIVETDKIERSLIRVSKFADGVQDLANVW